MPRFANLAAFVVSVVLTWGVCELALRWLGWGPNAAAGHGPEPGAAQESDLFPGGSFC